MRKAKLLLFLMVLSLGLTVALSACSCTPGPSYTITFMSNNDVYTTLTVESSVLVIMPKEPTKIGYEFGGWYYEGFEEAYLGSPITQSIVVYAKWILMDNYFEVNVVSSIGGYAHANGSAFLEGESVALTAVPANGYSFFGWYYPGEELPFATVEEYCFTMPGEAVDVEAVFKPNFYNLVVTAGLGGSVDGNESGAYEYRTLVTVIAVPDEDYEFKGWYIGEMRLHGVGAEYSFTMPANNYIIEARFSKINDEEDEKFDLTVIVMTDDTENDDGGSVNEDRTLNDVTLTATANSGYYFVGWFDEDDVNIDVDSPNVLELALTEERTITAKFATIEHSLTIIVMTDDTENDDGGSVNEDRVLNDVTLTASANSGYHFVGWYEDESLIDAELEYYFTLTQDRIICALFEEDEAGEPLAWLVYTAITIGTKSGLEVSSNGNPKVSETIVTIPAIHEGVAVIKIADNAFFSETGLYDFIQSIIIPSSVQYMGNFAFKDCKGLTSVTLPHSNFASDSFSGSAFVGCDSLATFYTSSASTPFIGIYVIDADGQAATEGIAVVFSAVTSIQFFILAPAVTSYIVPAMITQFYGYSFVGSALTSVVIGGTISSNLPQNTFYNCTNLSSLILPSTLGISGGAFIGCPNLTIYTNADGKPEGWPATSLSSIAVFFKCILSGDGTYVVSFDKDANTTPYLVGTVSDPYREGFTFGGWHIYATPEILYGSDAISAAPDGVYFAKWISIDGDGGNAPIYKAECTALGSSLDALCNAPLCIIESPKFTLIRKDQ